MKPIDPSFHLFSLMEVFNQNRAIVLEAIALLKMEIQQDRDW
jgi:hypothetical protein